MEPNFYNSKDEEHKHVINLLKDLPRERAADNFEYNLNVKIKNKNFELNTKERKRNYSFRVFAPAIGFVVSSVVLFFAVFNEDDSFENPFQVNPILRTEMAGNLISSSNVAESFGIKGKLSDTDVFLSEKENIQVDLKNKKLRVKEEVVAKRINLEEYPFDKNNSTDLDEALETKGKNRISSKASLASRGQSSAFFNGFFIREEVNKEYVDSLKSRMDSLKQLIKKQ